jgi:hypothetical protein
MPFSECTQHCVKELRCFLMVAECQCPALANQRLQQMEHTIECTLTVRGFSGCRNVFPLAAAALLPQLSVSSDELETAALSIMCGQRLLQSQTAFFLSKEVCWGRKIDNSCSTAGASERFPVRMTSAAVTPQVRLCSGCLPAEVPGRGLGAQSAPLLVRGGMSWTFALRRPFSCTVDLLREHASNLQNRMDRTCMC